MDEQQIKNLIKVWWGIQKRQSDPFIEFFILWICFNAWLEFKSPKSKDAEMIKWLTKQKSENNDLVKAFWNKKEASRGEFHFSIKLLKDNCPIYDSRGKHKEINIKDEDDFENIVWAIYRIRCNLFHGSKQAIDRRDIKLVKAASIILKHWVACLKNLWNKK